MLKRGVLAGLLALWSGCGANPVQQCNQTAAASCKKLFECWTSEADRTRLMLGASAEACTTSAQVRCQPPAVLCASPKAWDAAAAAGCVSEFEAITCSALRAGATPPSCSNTCT